MPPLLNAVLALVIGYPILRTNRHAFVISTLTFALLVALIARDWVSLTRGPLGIPNLPSPQAFGVAFDTTRKFYWIAWAFSVAMIAFLYALCSSRIGRTLIAIKQNEPLVRAQGISPMPYKLASFAISAAITGAAGGVFTFHLRHHRSAVPRLLLHADLPDHRDHRRRRQLLGRDRRRHRAVGAARGAALLRRLPHDHLRRDPGGGDVRHAVRASPAGCASAGSRACARLSDERASSTVTDLRKAYAGVHALDGVSFEVEAGSITGLIGPNGSGKSTAIDCISGFQKLDGGKVVARRHRHHRPSPPT